jgi:Flp pilus assembly secretin CpaC
MANLLGVFPGNPVSSTGVPPNSTLATAQLTGILTDPNFRVVLHAMESRKGFETLGEPEFVTTSGRQAQVRATDAVTIVTNFATFENPTNHEVSILPQVCQVETGVVLDVVPYVLADGYTLSLALIPSWIEFHGYAKTNTHAFYTSSGERIDVPGVHPLFRVQQLAATVNLWDNQTAVLGGMTLHKVQAEKIPVLGDLPWMGSLFRKRQMSESDILVFVTATILDPAGNRVHTDDELPFTQTGVPSQPK